MNNHGTLQSIDVRQPRKLANDLVMAAIGRGHDAHKVRFTNATNQPVLLVIAEETFTLKRTRGVRLGADAGIADLMSAHIEAGQERQTEREALHTRFIPLGPGPNEKRTERISTQRKTYLTALTGENNYNAATNSITTDWSSVHFENRVLDGRRDTGFSFLNKHLKVVVRKLVAKAAASNVNGGIVGGVAAAAQADSVVVAVGDTVPSAYLEAASLDSRAVERLRINDTAYVLRSSGLWTYATVQSIIPNYTVVFCVDRVGTTREYPVETWGTCIRCVQSPYRVGDEINPGSSLQVFLSHSKPAAPSQMVIGSTAFVQRTGGHWTFAVVTAIFPTNDSPPQPHHQKRTYRFIVEADGTTKDFPEQSVASFVRRIYW